MAQFEFGSVGTLSSTVTLIAFIVVVVFIIMFDTLIGVIEYLLGESRLYKRMIQTVYKELMLMGLISFIIAMINALESPKVINSFEGHRWILGIEFSHILMFFLTFFYVAMAFFLIRNSMVTRSRYQAIFREPIPSVLNDAEKLRMSPWKAFIFRCDYLNIFEVKERVELHLFNILFRDTYWMPKEFNVADYLSGCFDIYAQKTIDRSYVSWALLLCLAVVNYARVRSGIGFQTCRLITPPTSTTTTSSRYLSAEAVVQNESVCNRNMVKLFLVCAALLCTYAMIMVYFARLYRLRMLQRIGVNSAEDSIHFLSFAQQEEDTANKLKKLGKYRPDIPDEMTNAKLKEDIERVLDEDEHHGEEPEFKALAERLLLLVHMVNEGINIIQINSRRFFRSLFDGTSAKNNNAIALLAAGTAAGGSSSGSDSRDNSSSAVKDKEKEKEELVGYLHKSSFAHKSSSTAATKTSSSTTAASTTISTTAQSSPVKASAMHSPEKVPTFLPPPSNSPPSTLSARQTYSRDRRNPTILHQQSVMHFLQTLEVQDSNSSRRRLLMPTGGGGGGGRSGSNGNIVARRSSVITNNNNEATGTGTAAATSGGGRGGRRQSVFAQAYQAVVNTTTGTTNNSSEQSADGTQQHHQGRRNTVHIVAPENTLSIVEKFKLDKAKHSRNNNRNNSGSNSNKNITRFFWSLFNFNYNSVKPTTTTETEEDVEKGDTKSEEKDKDNDPVQQEDRSNEDFHQIYLFGNPVYFIRGVETCILLTCLYLAFWLAEFVAITAHIGDRSGNWQSALQILMMVPVIIVMPAISYISATAALLWAISELNLDVIYEILLAEEDTRKLVLDFRQKMYLRVQAIQDLHQDKDKVFEWLFQEIDQDGSGVVDITEFRYLLRALKLKYSDDRFKRLFAAVDVSGDGEISLDEFKTMMTFSDEVIAEIQCIQDAGKNQESNKDKKESKKKRHQNSHFQKSNRPTAFQDTHASSKNHSIASHQMRTLDEIPDDEKNDDDDDDDNDDEVFTYNMKPSDIVSRSRQSSSIGDRMRSLGSIDYSDTDSENEGPIESSPSRRISTRKSIAKSPGPLEDVLQEVLDEDNADQTPPSLQQSHNK